MKNVGRADSEEIGRAYSAKEFSTFVERFGKILTSYLDAAQANPAPVFSSATKAELLSLAAKTLGAKPEGSPAERFESLCQTFVTYAQRIHSPHYMGHQVPPPIPVAALFDCLASFTNQGLAISEMGPFSIAAERAIVAELGQMIGWKKASFDGIATGGGTLANLTAVLAARNIRYPDSWEEGVPSSKRPAIICSADAHYSISRAAGVIGIGTNQVIKAPLDGSRKMDPAKLPELLAQCKNDGLDVFCIVASSPSTATGSFDPIRKISEIVRPLGIWLHVDGAHGASVLFSKKHAYLVDGIELADSVTWDAHKMLFVPSLSTYLLFRDEKHSWASFKQEAPYLFDKVDDEQMRFNGGLRTLECTKRGLSIALWGTWSLYGKKIFEDLVDSTFAKTREFYGLLRDSSDFEALHEPQANILCFSYKAVKDQINLRQKLHEQRDFYISSTKLDGRGALRITLMNPLTETSHMKDLLTALRGL